MDADVVMNAEGDNQSIRADILDWIEKIEPYAMKLGNIGHMDELHGICANGSSSARQRSVFARNQSLREVTAFNMQEFKARRPWWE